MPSGSATRWGRDAFTWSVNGSTGNKQDLIVFQVKFARNPENADKRFLEKITQGELPKVEALKERGVGAYYLLTNVMGSAHLDVGSVDKMDMLLSEALGIPGFCWWRNDLDRRVDQTPDIKWSYPEIIRGSDLLQSLVEGKIGEEGRRRDDAIRSYIAAQHRDDREVKFKQVDLFNNLLDLFVDTFLKEIGRDETLPTHWRQPFDGSRRIFHHLDDDEELTAEFLLSTKAISQRIVLEGAPGQGKSTISQYICQVHRIRLLDHAELGRIPPQHLSGTLRIPLRVDLRDYASWLSGKNPFASELGALRPAETQGSLEAFLSFQITHTSGGHSFNVSDLSALSRVSHLLLVLDGFDEVADVTAREQIVREISKATVRLEATCRSLQVIVTSRPAAFAKSPGFPRKEWKHYSLSSMSLEQINNYADRWLKARQLPGNEQAKFKQVLREKLDQPHMRDLARNPMQLAILLNLIQTKGLSLPDKRTALYDSYMDLFFSREAEKSTIVRDHRDLLIDLHRYLAWVVQKEAEEAKSQGSIPEEKLRHLLKDYLAKEGHETALVDELFTGMIERVVALVFASTGHL
jgi:hypothetical protein